MMEAIIACMLGFSLVAWLFAREKRLAPTPEPDTHLLAPEFPQDDALHKTSMKKSLPSWLYGNDDFSLEVVSGLHEQHVLEQLCELQLEEGENREIDGVLVLEEVNLYDRHAVRVQIQGRIVGYLARHDAKAFRTRVREERLNDIYFPCKARVRGSWGPNTSAQKSYQVWLDIALYE